MSGTEQKKQIGEDQFHTPELDAARQEIWDNGIKQVSRLPTLWSSPSEWTCAEGRLPDSALELPRLQRCLWVEAIPCCFRTRSENVCNSFLEAAVDQGSEEVRREEEDSFHKSEVADPSAAVFSAMPTSTPSSLAARASSPSPPRTSSPAVLGTASGRARDLS